MCSCSLPVVPLGKHRRTKTHKARYKVSLSDCKRVCVVQENTTMNTTMKLHPIKALAMSIKAHTMSIKAHTMSIPAHAMMAQLK